MMLVARRAPLLEPRKRLFTTALAAVLIAAAQAVRGRLHGRRSSASATSYTRNLVDLPGRSFAQPTRLRLPSLFIATHEDDERIRVAPFDAVEIELAGWWWTDDEPRFITGIDTKEIDTKQTKNQPTPSRWNVRTTSQARRRRQAVPAHVRSDGRGTRDEPRRACERARRGRCAAPGSARCEMAGRRANAACMA